MPKSLAAGALNRSVTFEQQATTQDQYGAEQATWTAVMTSWASIRSATSRDVYTSAGFVEQLSHVITMRYSSTFTPTTAMRINYLGRYFVIQAVADVDEAHICYQLLCLERDA